MDAADVAKAAGLRYVNDAQPGIRRVRGGDGFDYVGVDGQPVRGEKELQRIKGLGIPPAWENVWISPTPRGHIQATGRDAKGRKQYRYHPHWREVRDETKYNRMILFGETLPMIRKWVKKDLARRDLAREKVLAAIVELLDETHIRIGNEEYARENESFGLTTLRDEHVDVEGSRIHFAFRGKSGKDHVVDVRDRRVANVIKKMHDIPGHELFHYLDHTGARHAIESDDVIGTCMRSRDSTSRPRISAHGPARSRRLMPLNVRVQRSRSPRQSTTWSRPSRGRPRSWGIRLLSAAKVTYTRASSLLTSTGRCSYRPSCRPNVSRPNRATACIPRRPKYWRSCAGCLVKMGRNKRLVRRKAFFED